MVLQMNKLTESINLLLQYSYQNNLMELEDFDYVTNRIFDMLQINDIDIEFDIDVVIPEEPSTLLNPILEYAAEKGLINPDTVTRRDIFEAKLMDIILPRPSELNNHFYSYEKSINATDYYYNFSQKSNYIKTSRTNKNIIWKSPTKYGEFDMTINLSKPEKDPRDIIAAGKSTQNKYPKCLLCKENVGYNGQSTNVGRTSHRIIPIDINNEPFYLQYSPYVYYNEHCIVLHKEHIPMNVTINTFKRLFDFVDMFPHYFLGSNAGLPIVGGSILSHEHYQGGRHHFPIEDAKVLHTFTINDTTFEQLYWPLSVVRISSENRESVINYADQLFTYWENYSNKELGIHSHTDNTPHNAITPIARKTGDTYILDMTLRNNRQSDEYPLGIFHPHKENHHIKKENIGLIEVMGLAVLPARLKKELPIIKEALLNNKELPKELAIYNNWLTELKSTYQGENIDTFINNNVATIFMRCIENAGVFKQTAKGQQAFTLFMKELEHVLNQ
jgi:UDPglucose--hexose-1-phosphate uridylyltransferase